MEKTLAHYSHNASRQGAAPRALTRTVRHAVPHEDGPLERGAARPVVAEEKDEVPRLPGLPGAVPPGVALPHVVKHCQQLVLGGVVACASGRRMRRDVLRLLLSPPGWNGLGR